MADPRSPSQLLRTLDTPMRSPIVQLRTYNKISRIQHPGHPLFNQLSDEGQDYLFSKKAVSVLRKLNTIKPE